MRISLEFFSLIALNTVEFDSHRWLIVLDKYGRDPVDDKNTNESPASPGFLDRFTPTSNRITALALQII